MGPAAIDPMEHWTAYNRPTGYIGAISFRFTGQSDRSGSCPARTSEVPVTTARRTGPESQSDGAADEHGGRAADPDGAVRVGGDLDAGGPAHARALGDPVGIGCGTGAGEPLSDRGIHAAARRVLGHAHPRGEGAHL